MSTLIGFGRTSDATGFVRHGPDHFHACIESGGDPLSPFVDTEPGTGYPRIRFDDGSSAIELPEGIRAFTAAESISRILHDDGTRYYADTHITDPSFWQFIEEAGAEPDKVGDHLKVLIIRHRDGYEDILQSGWDRDHRDPPADPIRYVLNDGSAIIDTGAVWHLEGKTSV